MQWFWYVAGIATGALPTFFVMVLYIVCSGLGREGERRSVFAEAWRGVYGRALRWGLVRRAARREVEVADEAEEIRAGR